MTSIQFSNSICKSSLLFSANMKVPSVLVIFLTFFAINGESKNLNGAINTTSISALFAFGDSTLDSGNNNYVGTLFRSNFPPYGNDFAGGIPTGRFSNGRLVTDFIASYVGLKESVPPYLDPSLNLQDLMTGVCFASAGTGLDPLTATIASVLSLPKQLEYFKEYKAKLESHIGKERTKALTRQAVFLISAGTNDVVNNYFGTPIRRQTYDISAYQHFLVKQVENFLEHLREEGARLIVVVGMPPIGCIPMVITLTSGDAHGSRACNAVFSSIAADYNAMLQKKLEVMRNATSVIVYADIYKLLNDLIQKPSKFGFDQVNTGCCGSGLMEASFFCNSRSIVCPNTSKYVFFDAVHPTEATYKFVFEALRPKIDLFLKNHHV